VNMKIADWRAASSTMIDEHKDSSSALYWTQGGRVAAAV
jgi:hypothetical protein